jgi:hypothetical protein
MVALICVWPKTGVVTLIVVVVATVSPAPPLNCTVWTWLALRLLSAMLAVPVMAAAVVGAKSMANEQLVPEARLDGCDPVLSWGQVLLLSNVKPAEMLGFWPDVGTVKARGALPIFVTATVLVLFAPTCALAKLSAPAETFTTRTPAPPM